MIPADPDHPGVFMESTHHILKTVAGAPNPRPPFFFDILDEGEGLTDVGTHLVDLVQWTLFPDQALDYRQDIQVQGGKRWATPITAAQFQQVTGAASFPCRACPLRSRRPIRLLLQQSGGLQSSGSPGAAESALELGVTGGRGFSSCHLPGNQSERRGAPDGRKKYQPELFVAPNGQTSQAAVAAAVRARIERLQATYPGVGV